MVAWLILPPYLARGAVVKGRVIDSAGQPVAAAQIRVWRKGQPADQPVLFDNKETLLTDADGRFVTPDVFDAQTPLRIVAQSPSTTAGRSGWILPQQEVTEVDDIVLRRLQIIVGQVVDTQGNPVAGATIFNGAGHQRVETKSGSKGKFLLQDVPAGARFVFAEKPGYHFTGVLLGDDGPAELRMVPNDEPLEPLRTHAAVLSEADRTALARRLLDPYREAVSRQGSDTDKYWTLHELSTIDPNAAFDLLERIGFADDQRKQNCRGDIIIGWLQHKPATDWDRIFAAIQTSADHGWAAGNLLRGATHYIPISDRDRCRQWLQKAMEHARPADEATGNLFFLAWAVAGFNRIGDRDQAATLAREVESMLKESSQKTVLDDHVLAQTARSLAPMDLHGALDWLDEMKDDSEFSQGGAFIAFDLAAVDAKAAEEIWNHIYDRATSSPIALEPRDRNSPEVCFRMARLEPERAWRIASKIDSPFWRLRARTAVACAVDGPMAAAWLRRCPGRVHARVRGLGHAALRGHRLVRHTARGGEDRLVCGT